MGSSKGDGERRSTPTSLSPRWARGTDCVRARYRRLAAFYPAFEVLFALPRGARALGVRRLAIGPGCRVLEVGCGTGRNLPFLVEAVGPGGRVYGVDATSEMLEVARRSLTEHGWTNVVLVEADAETYAPPEPLDAVLFSLSYSVIPRHRETLRHVWTHLLAGGRVVVLDATVPRGAFGEWIRPIVVALSRATVLGNPNKRPWEDLGELTTHVHREDLGWWGYYLSVGVKPTDPADSALGPMVTSS